jgi:hypothetical protein
VWGRPGGTPARQIHRALDGLGDYSEGMGRAQRWESVVRSMGGRGPGEGPG